MNVEGRKAASHTTSGPPSFSGRSITRFTMPLQEQLQDLHQNTGMNIMAADRAPPTGGGQGSGRREVSRLWLAEGLGREGEERSSPRESVLVLEDVEGGGEERHLLGRQAVARRRGHEVGRQIEGVRVHVLSTAP